MHFWRKNRVQYDADTSNTQKTQSSLCEHHKSHGDKLCPIFNTVCLGTLSKLQRRYHQYHGPVLSRHHADVAAVGEASWWLRSPAVEASKEKV